MAKSAVLIRSALLPNTLRRHISSTKEQPTPTSSRQLITPKPSNLSYSLLTSAALKPAPPETRPRKQPDDANPLKPFNDIPGPLALSMLRHSAYILPRIGTFHHTLGLGLLEGLQTRYGDLVRLGTATRTRPVLYVFDLQMMAQVYESGVTEPPYWEKSPLSLYRESSGGCPMNRAESQAIWKVIRSLFQDGSVIKNYETVFNIISMRTSERLGELRNAENALNEEIETEIYRWALETLGVMLFGIRLGCLDGDVHRPCDENRKPHKTSIEEEDIPDKCSLSQKPLEELTPPEQMVRGIKEIAHGGYLVRSEHTLNRHSDTFTDALKAFDTHFSLTEYFLAQAESQLRQGELRDEQMLLDKLRPLGDRMLPTAAEFLLAGVNPLAHTALSMLYYLSLHAAQQQRAHDEVQWANEAAAETSTRVDTPYIAACAREAMRLHPVTGGVVRRSVDCLAVGGYEVPAGVDIVLAHSVTSKKEEQWGRAKAFIPERWSKEGWEPLQAHKRAHPLASLPFGENCPATEFTGHILTALAARMVDKYRLEWHGPAPSIATTGVNRLQPPYYFVLQNAA